MDGYISHDMSSQILVPFLCDHWLFVQKHVQLSCSLNLKSSKCEVTESWEIFNFFLSCFSEEQQSDEHVWHGPHVERRMEWLLQSGLHVLWKLLLPLYAKGDECPQTDLISWTLFYWSTLFVLYMVYHCIYVLHFEIFLVNLPVFNLSECFY